MKYNKYVSTNEENGWLNLKPGDNKVRIVSEFETFGRHYDQVTKKATICIGKKEGCSDLYTISLHGVNSKKLIQIINPTNPNKNPFKDKIKYKI